MPETELPGIDTSAARRKYVNNSKISIIISILTFAAINTNAPLNAAEAIHHETQFILSVVGIPVGKIAMAINVANGYYSINGSGKTFGVSKLFSNAKGSAQSKGHYLGNTITNMAHKLSYTTKKKRGSVNIKFGKNGVEKAVVNPAVKIKPGMIIVKPSHLKSVQDPLRTTIIAVSPGQIGNGAAICNRTLPVYDGKNRFNIKLRFKGTRKVVTKGFNGLSYVCAVRYQPVAGHRPFKKHIKRLKANNNMEIAMAQIGNSSLYGLIQFKVKTKYGTVIGKPSYYRSVSKLPGPK